MPDIFFDPKAPIKTTDGGDLPHWHQDGKLQFVTFRLADSLPSKVIEYIKVNVERFNKLHPKPWTSDVRREYWSTIGHLEERHLNNGLGSCLLRVEAVRQTVARHIMRGDGTQYHVLAYVIMPNHVHLLLRPIGDNDANSIVHTIKRGSAMAINHMLNRKGPLWQSESFDRLVRSPAHLDNCLDYIKTNPHGLPPHHFTLYLRNDFPQ